MSTVPEPPNLRPREPSLGPFCNVEQDPSQVVEFFANHLRTRLETISPPRWKSTSELYDISISAAAQKTWPWERTTPLTATTSAESSRHSSVSPSVATSVSTLIENKIPSSKHADVSAKSNADRLKHSYRPLPTKRLQRPKPTPRVLRSPRKGRIAKAHTREKARPSRHTMITRSKCGSVCCRQYHTG